MTVVDFAALMAEAKTVSFDVLPDGDYPVQIEESIYKESQTGKPMIKVKARVTSGQHARRVVNNNFVLTVDSPQALSIFFRHMNAFGIDESWIIGLGQSTLEPLAQALLNRQAVFTLGKREWPTGQTPPVYRNEVQNVKQLAGTPQLAVPPGSPPSAVVGVPAGLPGVPAGLPAGLPGLPNGLPGVPAPAAVVAQPAPAMPAGLPTGAPAAQPLPAPPAAYAPPPVQNVPAPAAVPPPPVAQPASVATPAAVPAPPPVAQQYVAPPPAPVDTPVPGYEAIWHTLPDAAKDAIRAATGVAAPVVAPTPAAAPPPPPTLPV